MKVRINIVEEDRDHLKPKGLTSIFKSTTYYHVYIVKLQVEFSEEEKEIITKNNFWNYNVYKHDFSPVHTKLWNDAMREEFPEPIHYVPTHILNEVELECADIVEAKMLALKLREEVLPRMKNFLTAAASPNEGTEFEL